MKNLSTLNDLETADCIPDLELFLLQSDFITVRVIKIVTSQTFEKSGKSRTCYLPRKNFKKSSKIKFKWKAHPFCWHVVFNFLLYSVYISMIQHITAVNRGCASRGVHATRVSLYHNQSKSFPKSITFYTSIHPFLSLLDVFAAFR